MCRIVRYWLVALATAWILPGSINAQESKTGNASEKNAAAQPNELTIGSDAPALDIEHWVQEGEGYFAKAPEFESGKVYVVEFWATWCGPCISSMPHLVELQAKYASRGVQVVSVSREKLETVEKFLKRKLPASLQKRLHGEDPVDENSDDDQEAESPTFADLTKSYCLTCDPDGSVYQDYMRAASQSGIPCAFIVGKDTKIEWIGHPMSMDEPLEQVVTDSWDRNAYAAEFESKQQVNRLQRQISLLLRKGDIDKAVALIDDEIEKRPGKASFQFMALKFNVLSRDKDYADQAAACAVDMFAQENLDPQAVNNVAWRIYLMTDAGRLDNDEVLRAALDAGRNSVTRAGALKPYLLDTIAHLEYELGDAEAALKTQQQAFDSAPPENRARLLPFLKELKQEFSGDSDNEPRADTNDGAN